MNKINKKSFLLIAIALIVVLTTCLCLFTLGSSYAGSWTAGELDYFGSKNICEYDLVVSANLAYDHKFTAMGFKVQMIGVRCERNIFTTFQYLVDFKLEKLNSEVSPKTNSTTFKITKASQIGESSYRPILFESSSLSGTGTYKLSWTGRIKSNVDSGVSGSYTFEIV